MRTNNRSEIYEQQGNSEGRRTLRNKGKEDYEKKKFKTVKKKINASRKKKMRMKIKGKKRNIQIYAI